MQFAKKPIALAVLALCASAPFAAQAAISVSFKAPASGATLTNVSFNGTSACEVTGTDIKKVVFSLVSSSGATTTLNTELSAPWQCVLNSKNFADGNYTLRAVAYDSANRTATANRPVTIKNGTTTSTTDAKPTVSFTAPANNATISQVTTCTVSAKDDKGVKQVQFFMDGTLLSTDTTSAYTCSIDNKKYTNGAHTLKAVVTDSANQTAESQITVNISGGIGTVTPPTTNTPPVVSFKSPANGVQLPSGGGLDTCEVNATDANGIQKIDFYMNGALYHTETLAPYTCGFAPGKFANGSYALKAVAFDKLGAQSTAQVALTIGSATPPPTTNTPPTVAITAPATGSTLTGKTAAYAATASDTGGSVAKVEMYVGTKLVDTKTAAPYSGTIDTTTLPNGTATLMAVATDNQGATSSTQRSVTINNTVVSNPGGDPTTPPSGGGSPTTLPSTNAKAVATFESLGMYWKPGSAPSDGTCSIRYRKTTDSAWQQGYPMWYDSRDGECRGSIVHLAPGTDYAVEMGVGSSFSAGVNTRTWAESFPVGQTVQVQNG